MPIRPPHLRLSAAILAYAMAESFGLACTVLGASWFAAGKGALLADFPTSTADAATCIAGGIAVMLWPIARLRHRQRT